MRLGAKFPISRLKQPIAVSVYLMRLFILCGTIENTGLNLNFKGETLQLTQLWSTKKIHVFSSKPFSSVGLVLLSNDNTKIEAGPPREL